MLYLGISFANWTLAVIAVYTIVKHSLNTYDPSMLMKVFQVPTQGTARTVAFCLVLINGYDLLGALQNNVGVFWYSIAARLMGAVFFWSCGSPWNKLIGIELKTTSILLGAQAVARIMG